MFVCGHTTSTSQLALWFPSTVVAVIVALPIPTAVTVPSSATVAISSLLEVHVIAFSVASDGSIVAFNFCSLPAFSVKEVESKVIPVVGTFIVIVLLVTT